MQIIDVTRVAGKAQWPMSAGKVILRGGQEVTDRGGDGTQWKIKWEGDADADSLDSYVKSPTCNM